MSCLTSLSTELIELIFHHLQSISSGPRYTSKPQSPSIPLSSHNKWVLTDPGVLYLASTCKKMREIYLLPFIAGNLVLELPENATRGNCHFCPSTTANGNTLHFLTRMREGYMGKRIVRFIFEIKCPLGGCKQRVIDVMRAVVGALGPELKVVAMHLGDDKDIHGTPTMQVLDDLSNCLLGMNLGSSKPDSQIPTRRTYNNLLTEEQLRRSIALHFYSAEKGGIPDVIFGVVTLCFLEHNKNSFSVQGKESGTWPGWMAVIFVRDEDAKDLEYDKPLPPIRLLTRGARNI